MRRIQKICNGVDAERFHRASIRQPITACPFDDPACFVIGTVGRMQAVKDQTLLAKAFIRALEMDHADHTLRNTLRLVMVGDGPLRTEVMALLSAASVSDLAWLPGERNDVPDILRGLDCFVLPSLAEGISNTILEAMACGLPVIATAVGGSGELVESGVTGELVPAADVETMAQAIVRYARDRQRAIDAGQAGRAAVERQFSLKAMVRNYQSVYEDSLKESIPVPSAG